MKDVLYFTAKWCRSCTKFTPTFEHCARTITDVNFDKIDVTQGSEIAEELNIQKLPTVIIKTDGRESHRLEGKGSCETLEILLEIG